MESLDRAGLQLGVHPFKTELRMSNKFPFLTMYSKVIH